MTWRTVWATIHRGLVGPDEVPAPGPRLMEDRYVRLIESTAAHPVTLVEQVAVAALQREGPMSVAALANRVGHALYADAFRRSGWTVDIGILSPRYFIADAWGELEARRGVLWTIEHVDGER